MCVVVKRYETGETKSRAALRDQILRQTWIKRNRNLRKIKTSLWRACSIESKGFFWWHKAFSVGHEIVEDEPRSRRPCTSKTEENVTKVRALVCLIDVWRSEWSVVSWIWITKPSTTFWPRNWASGKFVQSWFQKTSPKNKMKTEGMCAWTFLNASKMTKILSNITRDESWILEYDPETGRQISEWHTSKSPRPKKATMSK